MSISRTILVGLAGGALFLGTAVSVMAQPPQGPGPGFQRAQGGPGGPGRPDRGGNPAERAQRLHEQLGITAAQEPAFQAFMATTARGPENRPDPAAMRDLTTPQRLERQLAELQARVTAVNRLYSVLTVDQKQAFDDLPPGMVMGGGRGQGGPGAMAMRGGGRGPGGEGGQRGPRGQRGAPGAYDPQ